MTGERFTGLHHSAGASKGCLPPFVWGRKTSDGPKVQDGRIVALFVSLGI